MDMKYHTQAGRKNVKKESLEDEKAKNNVSKWTRRNKHRQEELKRLLKDNK
jgi:hypothetical protein